MPAVSLGEIVLLLLVGIIVVGPRNLPTMMRTAGQWIGRLRRLTTDLRSQSGIDDILRKEGLDEHIHQLRSLSRMNVVESLIAPAAASASPYGESPATTFSASGQRPAASLIEPLREREYPLIGCDAAGALPDDAITYRNPLPDRKPPEATEPPAMEPRASEPVEPRASASETAEGAKS